MQGEAVSVSSPHDLFSTDEPGHSSTPWPSLVLSEELDQSSFSSCIYLSRLVGICSHMYV